MRLFWQLGINNVRVKTKKEGIFVMSTLDSLTRQNLMFVLNSILNQYKTIQNNIPEIENADFEISNAKIRIDEIQKIPPSKKSSKSTVGTVLIVLWGISFPPLFLGGLSFLLLGSAMDTIENKEFMTISGILAIAIHLSILFLAIFLKKLAKKEMKMRERQGIEYQNRDDVKAVTNQKIKEEIFFIEQQMHVSNYHRDEVNKAIDNLNSLYTNYNIWPDMCNIHAVLFMCYEIVCSTKTSINEIRQQYIRMLQHDEIIGLLNRQIQIIEQGFSDITGLLREGIRLDQIRNNHLERLIENKLN